MIAIPDRSELLATSGSMKARARMHTRHWLAPLLILALFLGSPAISTAFQVGGPGPIEWEVPSDGGVTEMANNQAPGNYKLHNNGGTSPVRYQVQDSNGNAITEWVTVDNGDDSPTFGVGQGEQVRIEDTNDNGRGAKGTITAA